MNDIIDTSIKPISLFTRFELPTVKSKRNERGDLVSAFTVRLNQERGSYKPLPIKRVGYLLSIYPTGELYFFLDKCNKAKNFSKCFWWHCLPKN